MCLFFYFLIRFSKSAQKREKIQYGLLVQDQRGTLCEVQLPECYTDNNEWKEIVATGEGKVYNFTNLKIVQRTNQAK